MIWLCDILSRSNVGVRSYGPDTVFRYMSTVTLTSDISPWIMVMTHYWVMVNNCVKYYSDPKWQRGIMAQTRILAMCVQWPWHWRYDLGLRSWHTLGAWSISVRDIIQIQLGSEEIWPWHRFSIYVHCDHDLEDMTLGQGHDIALGLDNKCVKYYPDPTLQWGVMARTHINCDLDLWNMTLCQGNDTPLGHGQQLSEILSRSNLAVRSYGPDTDFGYVCTVTLTFEIWPCVKVTAHP